ncbi:MAG: UdgX family uracil-DNA binding protein [Woeseiaceae bacterium]|nr:UdgX family uracil-DNA binding protein [Woeseiaceae bacterium]
MTEPVAITLDGPADYDEWRSAARRLLAADVNPDRVGFRLATASGDLFDSPARHADLNPVSVQIRVPREFPALAREVICHSDSSRFALLYRLLWRLQREPRLLDNVADIDVHAAKRLAKSVRRDTHKMKAFVRFRRANSEAGEVFVAWFEPDHHIVERTAPFFARRFAGMRWSIVTPERSAHWDGDSLAFRDGASRRDCPDGDALEEHWRVYYSSIFNPARLKVRAMKAEMPTRYWRNLPESRLIPELTRDGELAQRAAPAGISPSVSAARRLVAAQPEMRTHIENAPRTLDALAASIRHCTRCRLCRMATAAVPGEGAPGARLMIVGEQPGDHEDLTGRPFVGPAGRVLDDALAETGIDRDTVFLTNAVKHFKHTLRGKRRIHQRPNVDEIETCRWWLANELGIVRPDVVLTLGETAARAVFGEPLKVADVRGKAINIGESTVAIATVHPAYLLRLPDRDEAREERALFINDVRDALQLATSASG